MKNRKMMIVELMSCSHAAEQTVVDKYLLNRGVPDDLNEPRIVERILVQSPNLLREMIVHFFIAGFPRASLGTLLRSRETSYCGYEDIAQDVRPRAVTSMDLLELREFVGKNSCERRPDHVRSLAYAMMIAGKMVCPNLLSDLAPVCISGCCDSADGACERRAKTRCSMVAHLLAEQEPLAEKPFRYVAALDLEGITTTPTRLLVRRT